MSVRCVAFLSDYGHRDPFVGICHAVIKSQDASVPVIDLTHGVNPQDVRGGALALADSVLFLPEDAVAVAVVDPGVGGARRAVAVQTERGLTLIGPDNGLLWPALELCGGATEVVELSSTPWRLLPTSDTFHGRDIFSAVAAHLATGAALLEAGDPLDPKSLITLELPMPTVIPGELATEALEIDSFGNVRLAAVRADLEEAGLGLGMLVEIESGGLRSPAHVVRTFGDVSLNEPLVFEDASGWLAIGVNEGNAALELGIKRGKTVRIFAA